MSLAWEVTNEDVANVLDVMVKSGEIPPYTEKQLDEWADFLEVDEVESAALYGDDMDSQVGLASNEIARQLREIFVELNK